MPPEPRPQNGVQQSSPESGQTAAPPTLEIEVAEEGVGQREEDVDKEEGVVLSPLSTACKLRVWTYFMLHVHMIWTGSWIRRSVTH